MGMLDNEDLKNNGLKTQRGYNIIQIILAAVMLAIGIKYLPEKTVPEGTKAPIPEDVDPCPNGAAYYLYVAGIVLLVSNLILILSQAFQWWAEKDGEISCGEGCLLGILKFSFSVISCVDIVVIIWGSVVVFGAWAGWTDDWKEYEADPENKNFCPYQPMMTAFVLLILKWVLIPVIVATWCCCAALCASCICCGHCLAKSSDQA